MFLCTLKAQRYLVEANHISAGAQEICFWLLKARFNEMNRHKKNYRFD